MTRARKPELTAMNLLLYIFVVLIHCCSDPVTRLSHESWQYALVFGVQRLASMAVPGFFFLSGLKLMLRPTPYRYGSYLKKRFWQLALPYLLWSAVYFAFLSWRSWITPSVPLALRYLLTGETAAPFYFLIALAQFDLLYPLWRRLTRVSAMVLVPLSALLTVSSILLLPGVLSQAGLSMLAPFCDRLFTGYLVWYVGGLYVGRRYEQWRSFWSRHPVLILGLFFLFAAVQILFDRGIPGGVAPWLVEIAHLCYCGAATVFVLWGCSRVSSHSSKESTLISKLSAVTLSVYFSHCLWIYFLNALFARLALSDIGTTFVLRLALTLLLSFGTGLAWRWVCSRVVKQRVPSVT